MSEIISSSENGIQPTTTTWDYWQLVNTAIEKDDLGEVESKLRQWRADTAVAGPSTEQIDYLVPQAARDDGHPKILEYLLALGGRIGTHAISLARSPAVFQVFMAHGWEVDDSILRSNVRHPDLVALFLSKGVDPNSNPNGFSILDSAARSGPLESVELLFNHGASIGPSSSALHTAAQGDAPGRIPIMDYLLKQGADVNSIAADMTGPSEARRSGRKGTPLHTAFKWANEEAKEWLLEHGADPEAKNQLGETPAEWGRRFDSDGPESIVRWRRAQLRRNTARELAEKQHKGHGGEI
ncbi:MAG: hypothetical protein LQ337_000735 [Flavoplaca oasis]|nr:MAG: hypothetical protein LQ337_000735 [Flavoplaca oasis]